MESFIITTKGVELLATAMQGGSDTLVTKMGFGYVNFSEDESPSTSFAWGEDELLYSSSAVTTAKMSEDVVVWSCVLNSTVGGWIFNCVTLQSGDDIIAVLYQDNQSKTVTSDGVTGNTIIKNLSIQLEGLSESLGVTVDAGSWQQDLSALYASKSHNHDLVYAPISGSTYYEVAGATSNHDESATAHATLFEAVGTALAGKASSDHEHQYMEIPDWSLVADLNFNTTYSATQAGWLAFYITGLATANYKIYLEINEVSYDIALNTNNDRGAFAVLPVGSGDSYKITIEDWSGTTFTGCYFKAVRGKNWGN